MSVCVHGKSIDDDCIHCIELKALRETVVEMRIDLAKCFMELYDLSFPFADDLAEKYFDSWQEIREAANRQ